ncbi:hypothetical protein BN1723_012948 [Verticillium longisporum]|uniref:Uncharacterized protein n=1 Tax=Verticillium longisporum TaxID=100787 RepID=A0A0G4LN48_VERLO|nr:hypothetical protein BN1723_012948 [Verticillium longisporum]
MKTVGGRFATELLLAKGKPTVPGRLVETCESAYWAEAGSQSHRLWVGWVWADKGASVQALLALLPFLSTLPDDTLVPITKATGLPNRFTRAILRK